MLAMTTVTATDSARGFSMSDNGFVRWGGTLLFPAFNVSTVFGYTASDTGEAPYAPQNVLVYGDGDFTFDGSSNPTGGHAHTVNINIDNNPNVAGIDNTYDVFINA